MILENVFITLEKLVFKIAAQVRAYVHNKVTFQ